MLNMFSVSKIKIDCAKVISIRDPPSNNELVRDFLMHWMPDNIKDFTVYKNSSQNGFVDTDFYQYGHILPNVTNKISMSNHEFSKTSLEEVVKASANCGLLEFINCKFDCEQQLDFSGATYTMSSLSFSGCGTIQDNKWENNENRFINLMKGIANSGLKHSLATIDIRQCGVSNERVQAIMQENEISSIQTIKDEIIDQKLGIFGNNHSSMFGSKPSNR